MVIFLKLHHFPTFINQHSYISKNFPSSIQAIGLPKIQFTQERQDEDVMLSLQVPILESEIDALWVQWFK